VIGLFPRCEGVATLHIDEVTRTGLRLHLLLCCRAVRVEII
jgi:hypothetical protein